MVVDWNEIGVKALASLVILVAAFAISYGLQWPVKRLLSANEQRKVGGTIFQNIVRVLVWGWAACMIIDVCFGVDMAGVFGALGIVGVAVSLGAQQTIANVIGGIIVSLSGMVGPGDWITIQGHKEARVIDTTWRRTTLEDEDGIQYAVPNSLLVSSTVEKGNRFFAIIVPFALKPGTPNVEELLVRCEQVVLDKQVAEGLDCEGMRPKAYVTGSTMGAINAEVKLYANRANDSRSVMRASLSTLIEFLQKENVLADIDMQQSVAV